MRLPADIYWWLWQINDEFNQKVWKPEQSWAAKQLITAWLAQNPEKVTEIASEPVTLGSFCKEELH